MSGLILSLLVKKTKGSISNTAEFYLLGKLGFLHHDVFTLATAMKFLPATAVFYLAIFTSTNRFRYANVNTFIVFCSLTRLLLQLPTPRLQHTHGRLLIWLNTSGFVLYNNLLSLMMPPVFSVLTGEYVVVLKTVQSSSGWLERDAFRAVGLSCVFGLMISFLGFAVRKLISTTAFTVIGDGIVYKFLTVAINVLIWYKHSSNVLIWYKHSSMHS